VALRCRDPCIRREAISLLRTPLPTEEQWSRGKMLADVAEFIMALEEAAAMTPVPLSCLDIPHASRLHLLSFSFFSYDRAAHRYQISHTAWDPDLIKCRVVRSAREPAGGELETFWIDRRLGPRDNAPPAALPQDVPGLFPQIVVSDTKLWDILGGRKVAEFLERASASHIFSLNAKRLDAEGGLTTVEESA